MVIETLERRSHFDATFDPKTGLVFVQGTTGSDTIHFFLRLDSDTGQEYLSVAVNIDDFTFKNDNITGVRVSGGSGSDNIDGSGAGHRVTLDGGAGDDTLVGGSSGDKLIGGGGSNSLSGGAGNDLLVAGLQADTLNGESGNDRFIPDNTPTADDILAGGAGIDVVDYSESKIKVVALVGASPKPNQANDVIHSDVEQINGSAFADKITDATKHPLQIFGGDGNDTLTGGSGNDTLVGGSGRDSLLGMGGNDHFRTKDGEIDSIDGGHGSDFIEESDNLIVRDVVKNV